MIMYHGTSETAARAIRHAGLRPRSRHRRQSNWGHVFTGSRHAVYLTDAYPLTYAAEAVQHTSSTDRLAIIEIDTAVLDTASMLPDEDVLEQALRRRDDLPTDWSMARRCRYYKMRLSEYAEYWQTSLAALGTCAYHGSIPATAIRRIALIDVRLAAAPVSMALDASITFANYRLVGVYHKALTGWFFGEPLPVLEGRDWINQEWIAQIAGLSRAGIEIISACSASV